jgi:hypothetical protein
MDLGEIVLKLGCDELVEISRRQDRWKLQSSWHAAFAPGWHDWSGPLRDFDWHVFSYAYHWHGAAAISAYERVPGAPLVIAKSLANGPAFRCKGQLMPVYVEMRKLWPMDLYVMNEGMTWTFVMTHEHHIGPFFVESSRE